MQERKKKRGGEREKERGEIKRNREQEPVRELIVKFSADLQHDIFLVKIDLYLKHE